MSEQELLPCPFCGSDAIEVVRIGTGRVSCQVRCEDCGAFLESNENGYGHAWNTRPLPADQEAREFKKLVDDATAYLRQTDSQSCVCPICLLLEACLKKVYPKFYPSTLPKKG